MKTKKLLKMKNVKKILLLCLFTSIISCSKENNEIENSEAEIETLSIVETLDLIDQAILNKSTINYRDLDTIKETFKTNHPKTSTNINSKNNNALKTSSYPSTLYNGQHLYKNQRLVSQNGVYTLVHQGDGNVVLYKNNSTALWASSSTYGKDTNRLTLQYDGNLIITTNNGNVIWSTNTQEGYRSDCWFWNVNCSRYFTKGKYLVMQNDGNLVLYGDYYHSTGTYGVLTNYPLWKSDTYQN